MQLLSPKVKEIQEKYKENSSHGISGIREVPTVGGGFFSEKNTKLSNQIKGFWISSIHLEFPNGGFLKWWYPQIIHFNRVFHYFHHPFWGFSPYFWKHPNDRHGDFFLKFPPVPRRMIQTHNSASWGSCTLWWMWIRQGLRWSDLRHPIFPFFFWVWTQRWKPLANELNSFLFFVESWLCRYYNL